MNKLFPEDFIKLTQQVQQRAEQYEQAQNEASYARMRETKALNNLNKAQAEFDNAVAEAKKGSHYTSDWGRKK